MCRAGGRRCDTKWQDVDRERYNARRRITRNSEKAEKAKSDGNQEKAAIYDTLVKNARDVEARLSSSISHHEKVSEDDTPLEDKNAVPVPLEAFVDIEDPEDYRISHRAPSNNGYNTPLSNPGDMFPDDYTEHPDWYGAEYPETIEQVRSAKGNPDHIVTIYRGVPKGAKSIRKGDWVALSKEYAERESLGSADDGSDDGHVISARVPASTLFTEGSLEEWGYDGQQDIDTENQPDPATLSVSPALSSEDAGIEAPAAPPVDLHPLANKPHDPVDLTFIRNPVSSTNHVRDGYGQDIEPAGRYLSESSGFVPDGWESGTVRFEKPLHLAFGESGSYADDDNWKRRLSAHYGGKTGKALSKALNKDGYDAIITSDKYGTSEIVDLTGLLSK